ncbi:vesicle-associated membrane protein 7-like [Amphiura filiformis]|uniref:vesicle-associated membrane protein 7-like n=1 Tax=Amphiura filiformis TaxID=82378 RepID=UPI003B20F360
MAIQYGCVAVGRSIIADHSRDAKENFRAVVLSMLPNIATQQVRKVFLHKRYKFAVLPDNGILYICIMSPDFSEGQSFAFLKEVVQKFQNNNLIKDFSNDEDSHGGEVSERDVERPVGDNSGDDFGATEDLGVTKIHKFPGSLEKKMKNFSEASKKIPISRKKKKTQNDRSYASLPFVTPSSKSKYVALVEDEIERDNSTLDECAQAYAPNDRTINSLQKQVEEIQGIVREAIEKVLSKGENLDELLVRADNLEAAAYQFQKTTYRLTRKFRCKHRRLVCTVVGTGIVVTVVAVVFVVLWYFNIL